MFFSDDVIHDVVAVGLADVSAVDVVVDDGDTEDRLMNQGDPIGISYHFNFLLS